MMKNLYKTMTRLALLVVLFTSLTVLSGCGQTISAGNVGLVVNHYTGKVDGNVRKAGFNPQAPMSGNELIEIPTYKQSYSMARVSNGDDDSVRANTMSGNTLNVDVSITYHLNYDPAQEDRIMTLYDRYRTQFRAGGFNGFEQNQLRPLFRKYVANAFGKMSTVEATTGAGKRRAAADALAELNRVLGPDSIAVDEVRIRAVWPDERTRQTLKTHLVAEQNLRISTLNQQLSSINNEREVSKAEAEAVAAKIRAASLSPRLVRYKHLDNIKIIGVPRGAIVNTGAAPPASLPAGNAPAQ